MFNPGSIVNILSLSHESSKYRVLIDSSEEERMYINIDEGWINFRLNSLGLIAHDTRDRVSEACIKNKNKLYACFLFQMVDANSSKNTKEQTRMTNEEKYLSKRMGGVPLRRFSRYLNDDPHKIHFSEFCRYKERRVDTC